MCHDNKWILFGTALRSLEKTSDEMIYFHFRTEINILKRVQKNDNKVLLKKKL